MDKMLQTRKRVSWKDLSRLFPPNSDESERARSLFVSYEKNGYLRRDELSPEINSRAVIIDFYNRLTMIRSSESPVHRKKKAEWILRRDFARFNHRDISGIDDFPLLVQLSVLPSIRAGALVLAPFTANRRKELNTVDSHSLISSDYLDREFHSAGLSPEDQFHLFIDAVHLLGKCVGYTLDYRMDRFAVAVLRRPELFRWVDRNSDLPYREMLTEERQKNITDKVNDIVGHYLKSLSDAPSDEDYDVLRGKLKDSGLWTVPSCLDGTEQLPFYENDPSSRSPRFRGGEENLTSFKFHLSHSGSDSLRPVRHANEEAVNYYSSLYIKWRDSFSFDLVKFSSIDNVEDESARKADCPDLEMVRKVVRRTTAKISHTGIIGSLSSRPEVLASAGFNVLLHEDNDGPVDRFMMEKLFDTISGLRELNRKRNDRLAIALPCGREEDNFARRVFLSRFLDTGRCGIPKYETYPRGGSLYHAIENVYTRYREIMEKGELVAGNVDSHAAWWIIRHGHNLLIPLVSLAGRSGEQGPVLIDYSEANRSSRILTVLEYDFMSSGGDLFLCGDEKIHCEDLPAGGFRLFSVQ